MKLRNNTHQYGLIAVFLHWLMALLIIGLFVLGKYMVGLDYYHPWFQQAPDLHRSLGVTVAGLLLLRLGWRLSNPRPVIFGERWEQRVAVTVHRLFYALIAAITISGYLITTADGQGVSVFHWFEIPATVYGYDNQEDIAGRAHEWLANAVIALAVLHSLAALKHHFIDRDPTLRRMLGLGESTSSPTHSTKE